MIAVEGCAALECEAEQGDLYLLAADNKVGKTISEQNADCFQQHSMREATRWAKILQWSNNKC